MNSTCELGRDAARALKPYPDYKDSGVERLGKVPAHWEVVRLRNTSEMRVSNVDKHAKDDEQPVRLCNYVDVYKNDRIRSGMAFMRATATTDEIERFRLQCGDVLITKDSEAWNDIGVPALVEDTQDDIVSGYHLALLRPFPERVDGGYLFRALQSPAVAYQFHVEANGVTRYGLSHSAIRSVWLPLPHLSEQASIVRFLDHADRRIRRYIRAQQQLIALLEEQKQAIIHQAVTGQIDVRTGRPFPAYTPSGVEWLGGVPEHWEVRRMRHLVSTASVGIQMGPFGASLTRLQHEDTGYKLYGQENTISGNFGRGSRWITQKQFKELQRYELLPGDLVLTRKGSIGKCKVAAKNMVPGIIDSDTIRVRLDEKLVLRRFVVVLLHQATYSQQQIEVLQRGAVVGGLNTAAIAALCVVVPPVREQAAIVRVITSKMATLNAAVDAVCCQIEHVKEYRTRLIADVVTGKLDVREAAAGLPEVDPLAAEDDSDAVLDPEARLDGNELAVAVHEAEA